MPRHRRQKPKGRIRANTRAGRASLWGTIQKANERAHQRANRRMARRKGLTSKHAAIAELAEPDHSLNYVELFWRCILGLVLLIPAVISTQAIFSLDQSLGPAHDWILLLQSKQFVCFGGGAFLMSLWFFTRLFQEGFLYLYVLGHELTHAVFIYICGGSISDFSVSKDGGYVMTNKSNILIALSPYFVPFWSVIFLTVTSLLGLLIDSPYYSQVLYIGIGWTWTFHLLWTLWMIPKDQPDLKENGTFFSLVVIYLANVLIVAALLCTVPGGLTLKVYLARWLALAKEYWDWASAYV